MFESSVDHIGYVSRLRSRLDMLGLERQANQSNKVNLITHCEWRVSQLGVCGQGQGYRARVRRASYRAELD